MVRLFRFLYLEKRSARSLLRNLHGVAMVGAGEAKLSKIGDDENKAFDLDARTAKIEVIPKGRR